MMFNQIVRDTWNHLTLLTWNTWNILCEAEFFEIELFDYLTLSKKWLMFNLIVSLK